MKTSENISAIRRRHQKELQDRLQEGQHFHQPEPEPEFHHQDIQQKDLAPQDHPGGITIHKVFWKDQLRNLLTISRD